MSRKNSPNRYSSIKSRLAFAAALAVLGINAVPADAQVVTWTGGAGNWNSGANWTGGSAPNSGAITAMVDAGNGTISVVTVNGSFTVGTLNISSGDEVAIAASQSFNVTSFADIAGTLRIGNGANLTMAGSVNNSGRIIFSPNGNENFLNIGGGPLTINGAGTIQFDWTGTGPAGVILAQSSGTLTLGASQVVQGVGSFRNARVINQGLIDANSGTAGVLGAGMYIDPSNQSVDSFINSGTMRSSNAGLMVLTGDFGGGVTNNGTISAIGDGSITEFFNNAAVTGGTYATTGTGVVRVRPGQTGNIGGTTTLTAGSTLRVPSGATLHLSGAMTNDGNLELSTTGSAAVLNISAPLTLSGTGALKGVYGGSGDGPRVDAVSHLLTIGATSRAEGVIHFNNARLTNNGLMDANQPAGMYVDPNNQAPGLMVNNATLRSSGGGLMVITGDFGGDLINNGTISAIGANSITELYNSITVTGGNWTNSGGGVLRVRPGQTATLINPTIPAGSEFDVATTASLGATLHTSGTYTINGTLDLNSAGQTALMNIAAPTTLTGSGTLKGTYGGSGPGPRIDAVSQLLTISATSKVDGVIHFNNARVSNNGLIDANHVAGMHVDPNNQAPGLFVNNATMRSSNGGLMVLAGDAGGDLVNNGTISAIGANSITELYNSVTVTGGNWTNSGGGVLRVRPGQTGTLINPTIPAGSQFDVPGTSTLHSNGTYTINGTLDLNADGQTALMNIAAPTTITGTGALKGTWSGVGPGPRIDAVTHLLTIGATGTAEGVIHFNNARVTNNGLIQANAVGGILLDANNQANGPHFINNGTLRATNSATLTIVGDFGGEYSGNGPLIVDAGSTIQAQGSAGGNMGPVSGTGTYRATSSSNLGHQNFRVATLEANSSARARVITNGTDTGTSRVSTLTISGGKVDLTDNDMVIDHTGSSPQTTVRGYLQTGSAGNWTGNGLVTSLASNIKRIGYAEASAIFSPVQFPATFSGQTVDNTTLLIKYTYAGDTDLNGVVNFDDYSRTDTGFNSGGNVWVQGDFDYNGQVTFDDYALIDLAFNQQSGVLRRAMSFLEGGDRSDTGMDSPPLRIVRDHFAQFGDAYATSFLNAVPEPSSALFLSGLAALAASKRRRRTV